MAIVHFHFHLFVVLIKTKSWRRRKINGVEGQNKKQTTNENEIFCVSRGKLNFNAGPQMQKCYKTRMIAVMTALQKTLFCQ